MCDMQLEHKIPVSSAAMWCGRSRPVGLMCLFSSLHKRESHKNTHGYSWVIYHSQKQNTSIKCHHILHKQTDAYFTRLLSTQFSLP